ncbi:MAG: hypothetical protein KGK03_08410 [Candidatus Omnitrophica bacterium]|nr:hypothetical protein [Candidatus Omnitrophota bacterium]MDE2223077.1 hypothetical protein [Candidatus Omnitrophota bacterium]
MAHFPTLALGVGTISFWLELYVIRLPGGHASLLAWTVFLVCLLGLFFNSRWGVDFRGLFNDESPLSSAFILTLLLGSVYLAVGLYASLLPPHLVQESDALMYHITLPRQHLLRHSFAPISWSVPDLFLLPLDYALSPFELSTWLPNKLIQFIFFMGCLGIVFQLVYILSGRSVQRAWVGTGAIMACHAVAIQVGLAMLDLVMVYCFLASIHSALIKRWGLAAVEFAFYCWSKTFIPFQMAVIGIILGLISYWALRKGFSCCELEFPADRDRRTGIAFFIAASLGIALPCLVKTFYYTGTPFYPFGLGFFHPLAQYSVSHWHAILQRAADCVAEKDAYGHGRSLMAFIRHFWLIAVPEKGVNNAFDYPLGVVYLLVLAPFGAHVFGALKSKKLPVLSLTVVFWWLTWWFGSQQSRFLLVPVCLMIILTISFLPKLSKVLLVLIVTAMGLEVVSLINAHRRDWGKPFMAVLRNKDRGLVELKPSTGAEVKLDFPDAAFAAFPVRVHRNNSVYVMPGF